MKIKIIYLSDNESAIDASLYATPSYRQFAESLRSYYHHHHHGHNGYHPNNYASRYPIVSSYNGHHYNPSPTSESSQLISFPPQRYLMNNCVPNDSLIGSQDTISPSESEEQKFMPHNSEHSHHIVVPTAQSSPPPPPLSSIDMSSSNRNHHWW